MPKLSIGIVGLPNVGKSTLFNAITNATVEAANYPFCTIEPNTGVVEIPDSRLNTLSKLSNSTKCLHATIEFTDIAGLVKGASKGEGLGNQFLSNIRETSAIAHVVRCFDDGNITHVHGKIDPVDDADVINLELILADLGMVQNTIPKQAKKAKSDKDEKRCLETLEAIKAHLEENKPVRTLELDEKAAASIKSYSFLTSKQVIYVANIDEGELGTENGHVKAMREYAAKMNDQVIVVSAKFEQDVAVLEPEEKQAYLEEFGLTESGLDQLARASFDLLGLQTYLTTGEKETRAWTIRKGDTAPKAAGEIHTDFEKGFIRANIIGYGQLVEVGSMKAAKDKGLLRQEGKDYVMQDGDVVEFLFNV